MILLRHGQSTFNAHFNATRTDPGFIDAQLTDIGRTQAEAAAERLASMPAEHRPRRLITSPYTRALATAEIVADALDVRVTVETIVREHAAFTCDVGSPRSALAGRWPGFDFSHIDEVWWHRQDLHGAEPETAVAQRGRAFSQKMVHEGEWRTALVVTHWGFIRALTGVSITNAEHVEFDPVSYLIEVHG